MFGVQGYCSYDRCVTLVLLSSLFYNLWYRCKYVNLPSFNIYLHSHITCIDCCNLQNSEASWSRYHLSAVFFLLFFHFYKLYNRYLITGTIPLADVMFLAHTEFMGTDYWTDFSHSPTLLNFILFELLTETSRQGLRSTTAPS